MKYTKIPVDCFKTIQSNAGILVDTFDPATGEVGKILGATTGGNSFVATPTYSDFGEDIDNCPKNTKELKRLESWEVKDTGTFVSVSNELAERLVAAGDTTVESAVAHIVPRNDLDLEDFKDVWFVADYTEKNGEEDGGFIAIHMMDVLNTSGFNLKTTDKQKGQFSFEFTAHYSIAEQTRVPFEIYMSAPTVG